MKTIILGLLCIVAAPAMAQRIDANLACKTTGKDFVYDCVIRLTRAGAPLTGAEVTVGADMPSMPMAHNVRPAKARSAAMPGEYAFSLSLEMLGEWAVKVRLGGPVRDQLILSYEFDEQGARPIERRQRR